MAKRQARRKGAPTYTIDTPKVKDFLNYLSSDKAFETPHDFNAYSYSKILKTITPQQLYKYYK